MQISPVRGLVASLLVIGLLLLIVAALTGLLVVLALVVCLAVLNVVYLPRAARRVRLRTGWLVLLLMPVMILAGLIVGGVQGAVWGAGVWLVAIGLPRVVGRDLVRRTRRRVEARLGVYDVRPGAAPTIDVKTPTGDPGGRPLPPADGRARGEYGP